MHNRVPQLGYFHEGLNTFVYHDNQAPMGNVFSDLWGSITGGVSKTIDKTKQEVLDDISRLPDAAKAKAMDEFLKTGTGEQTVAEAKKTWLAQQADNVKTYYIQNKSNINMALAGVAALAVAYAVLKKPSRRQAIVQYIPSMPAMPSFAKAAAPAAPAAQNPRKRRHKRRK